MCAKQSLGNLVAGGFEQMKDETQISVHMNVFQEKYIMSLLFLEPWVRVYCSHLGHFCFQPRFVRPSEIPHNYYWTTFSGIPPKRVHIVSCPQGFVPFSKNVHEPKDTSTEKCIHSWDWAGYSNNVKTWRVVIDRGKRYCYHRPLATTSWPFAMTWFSAFMSFIMYGESYDWLKIVLQWYWHLTCLRASWLAFKQCVVCFWNTVLQVP